MSIFNKKKILVTHDHGFHGDDLFAIATLCIYFKNKIKIIRTRDPNIISSADVVCDVGGIYDPKKNLFDHHQKEGAGKRENGIPYASFGLIWKHFGLELCDNSKDAWDLIENGIVAPIDASDNGFDVVSLKFKEVNPHTIEQAFLVYSPAWNENKENIDKIFIEQVKKIIKLLEREIKVAKAKALGRKILMDAYNSAEDKRIVISEVSFSRNLFQEILSALPEPVYLLYPSTRNDHWNVEAVIKNPGTYESRKLLPESWRGILGDNNKLTEIEGVKDVLFCHRSGFLIKVKSKEGAIKLAQIALNSKN